MNELKGFAEEYTSEKKQIGNGEWLRDGFITYALAFMIAYLVYTLNEGRFENAGLLAVGGTLAMFVFISQSEKKPGVVMWLMTKIFIGCWLVLEVASIAGSYMSASNGHELNQYRQNKETAQNKINELRKEKLEIQNSNVSPAAKIYRKSEINKKIEALEKEASLIIVSNEGKYFDDLSKLTGIDNIGQIYQITLSALLVLAGSMLISLRNGVWCNWTLHQHIKQSAKTLKIMESCEVEKVDVIKSDSPKDLKESGTQKDEPKVNGDLDAAKTWVASHLVGSELSTKELRKSTETSVQTQQNAIIKELFNSGVLTRQKKGNIYKYSRAEPKQAALSQIKASAKLYNLFKK